MLTRREFVWRSANTLAFVAIADSLAFPAFAGEVTHSESEWRKLLTPDQYAVLREGQTEQPFSSALDAEKRAGTYSCAGCGVAVFSSAAKFDSRTGWPSFWKPLGNAVRTSRDTTQPVARTRVDCRHCDGHLGHVFGDGPRPTGLRYCINGSAMKFAALAN